MLILRSSWTVLLNQTSTLANTLIICPREILILQDLQKTTPAGKSEVKSEIPVPIESKTEVVKVDVSKPESTKKGEGDASKPTVTPTPVKPVVRFWKTCAAHLSFACLNHSFGYGLVQYWLAILRPLAMKVPDLATLC